MRPTLILSCLACLVLVPMALAQADPSIVFVANNGNLEGSVSALRVNPDGTLTLIDRVITGSRPSMNDPCPGCNPYEISLSPDGRYLVTGHAATSEPMEQLTFLEVAGDGTIEEIAAFSVLGTPMDVVWIDDEHLAAIRTESSPDQAVVYRFDPVGPTLTEVDAENIGYFSAYLALHPALPVLYAEDSGTGRSVSAFAIDTGGALTRIDTESTGSYYALELTLSHDGTKLYAAGGITEVVLGYHVAADGTLTPMAGSPFPESGDSPSNVFCSSDDRYLLVGHGSDATLRSAAIDPVTGGLTYTGFVFDVGLQGTLGDVATVDSLVFVTDNSTAVDGIMGIYSFRLNANGSFTQNGAIVSTEGIAPRTIAVRRSDASDIADGPGAPARPLATVFPNPLIGGGWIRYEMPQAGAVTIEIVDASGRVVRHLLQREEPSGLCSAAWDGTDDAGRGLPAGVYLARVRTAERLTTCRVLVLAPQR